ncbi:MAG: PilX N-terminal domain-containing pilus assembly protein [Vicinamibacteria bacterium]
MNARPTQARSTNEAGFALILAILALMLLTFLGLTLSTTTSTELQIATNYRWSQQALYNAEAGIEAAKVILRNIPTDWNTVLPVRRTAPWGGPSATPAAVPSAAPSTTATRNYENSLCDDTNQIGYGAVLDDSNSGSLGLGQAAAGPYENVTSFLGQPLPGAFSLWVRRDIVTCRAAANPEAECTQQGEFVDSTSLTSLVLVVEGVAPRPAGVGGALASINRAVRVLQIRLSRNQGENVACESAEGQTGTTASGANFGACAPLTSTALDAALGAAAGGAITDTGVK